MILWGDVIESPIGIISIIASDTGIREILLGKGEFVVPSDTASIQHSFITQCKQELQEYFEGKRTVFSVSLDVCGTAFQKKVWTALLSIPFGETTNYKTIAEMTGNINAARAIGNANNKNPLPILIPCHRVIGSSGKLVGYSGELWRKEWLLQHELNIRKDRL